MIREKEVIRDGRLVKMEHKRGGGKRSSLGGCAGDLSRSILTSEAKLTLVPVLSDPIYMKRGYSAQLAVTHPSLF